MAAANASTHLLQLQRQIRVLQERNAVIEEKFKETSQCVDLESLAGVSEFPLDQDGAVTGSDADQVEQWSQELRCFFHIDDQNGGRAKRVWQKFFTVAFPFMLGWPVETMLIAILMRTAHHRRRGASTLQYLELFCGRGNLSRACIAAGLRGVSLDVCVNENHDVLSASGFRLLLLALTASVVGGLVWVATPCSSFVVLSASVCRRNASNGFLGDTNRFCVEQGNVLADISGLVLLLGFFLGLHDGLEQPGSSCLPSTPVVSSVLKFIGARRTDTYHYCFGGPTLKPLQLWSRSEFMLCMERSRPAVVTAESSSLASRGEDGSFTGRKDLLHESQEYTLQFGQCVVNPLLQEWRRSSGNRV